MINNEGIMICDVCGITSNDKRIQWVGRANMHLCSKHKKQIYEYGKIIDPTDRTTHDTNEYVLFDDHAEMVIRDKRNNIIANALIDLDDVDRCKLQKWSMCKKPEGPSYIRAKNTRINIALHRYILGYNGPLVVDHINRNTLDNRKSNLRIATVAENTANNGHPGIYQVSSGKWKVKLRRYGKQYYSYGSGFDSYEDAVKYRDNILDYVELIDNISPQMYTQDQVEKIARHAAELAVRQALTLSNLDSCISEPAMPTMEGEENMGRHKIHVTLPTGERVWITGKTNEDLIANALSRFGNSATRPLHGSILFGDYANEVFDTFLVKRWKESTAKTNRFLMDKHILPYFQNTYLDQITTGSLQQFYDKKSKLSKSYTKQMNILLHQIFESAIEDELIAKDPTKSKRLVLPEKVTKREALETDQFRDVIANIPKLKHDDALLMALLCFTGMRRGEVIGLKWSNVTDTHILVRSEATFDGNTTVFNEFTKSEAGIRDLMIMDELKPYLEKRGSGFVIGNSKAPITQSKFVRTWQRIGKTINLYGATPHIIRHTFATELVASGADPKTVQTMMGHADFSFTMNTYVHKTSENMNKAIANLSGHISQQVDIHENAETVPT